MKDYDTDLKIAQDITKVIDAYFNGYFNNSTEYVIKTVLLHGEHHDVILDTNGVSVISFSKNRTVYATNMFGNGLYLIGARKNVLHHSKDKEYDLYNIFTEDHYVQQSLVHSAGYNTALFIVSYVNWWCKRNTIGIFSTGVVMKHLPYVVQYLEGLEHNAGL